MDDFKTYFFGLSVSERADFATAAGTSAPYLTQVAYGNKRVELGFADVVVKLAGGAITHDALPLTDNAKRQRQIRDAAPARAGA